MLNYNKRRTATLSSQIYNLNLKTQIRPLLYRLESITSPSRLKPKGKDHQGKPKVLHLMIKKLKSNEFQEITCVHQHNLRSSSQPHLPCTFLQAFCFVYSHHYTTGNCFSFSYSSFRKFILQSWSTVTYCPDILIHYNLCWDRMR